MKANLFKKNQRAHADHGWLKTNHYYSFANWYEPTRMGFGSLRVINNDTISPGEGFGFHPHDNMEIITIPLSGEVLHQDTIGGEKEVIKTGEIQVLSAGTGMLHSELNNSSTQSLELFQIWIQPKVFGVKPSYSQISFDESKKFQYLVSPSHEGALPIHQDAYISKLELDEGEVYEYKKNNDDLLVATLLVTGDITIDEFNLQDRDILEIEANQKVEIKANKKSSLLIFEIA